MLEAGASASASVSPAPTQTGIDEAEGLVDVVDVVPPPFPFIYSTSLPRSADKRGAAPGTPGGPGGPRKFVNKVPFFQLFRFADGLDKLLIFIGCIAGIAGGALMPLMMLLMGDMVDSFNEDSGRFASMSLGQLSQMAGTLISMDQINRNVKWMLALGATTFVLRFVVSLGCTIAASRQAKVMRTRYFQSALAQEMGWFDSKQTGALTTVITDIQTIEDGIGERVAMLLQNVAMILSGLIMGFVKGWKMSLVIIATTPVMMIASGILTMVMTRLVLHSTEFYTNAGQVATEILSSVRTVVAFGMQPSALKRYNDNLVTTRKMGTKKGWAMGAAFGMMFGIMFWTFGLAFWYASTLIDSGEMSAGNALTVFMVVSFGTMGMGQMAPLVQALAEASGAAYDIFLTIDRKSLIDPRDKSGDQVEIEGNVEFRGITFRYPTRSDTIVLHNFDLKVQRGQTVALVGPSGCGKSTVVGLLERFYDVEDGFGRVLIDGHPIKSINLQCLRRQVGIVSQEPVLFAKTIGENIAYGCNREVTREDIIEVAKQANAHDFISALPDGYNTLVGERGVQLSGGQKQRVAIARALIRNPKILIFDEATSALDTESERVVQAAIDQVAHGRTCIIIAHRLSTVRNADAIATINEGKVAELGTHDELMALNGLYRKLVERQQLEGGNQDRKHRKHHHGHKKEPEVSPSVTPVPGSKSPVPGEDQVEIDHAAELKVIKGSKFRMLRRAFGVLKPYLHITLLGCVASLADGAVFPVFGMLMSEMIGVLMWIPLPLPGFASSEEHNREVISWSLAFVGLGLAAFVVNVLKAVGREIASERMAHYLRFESFKAMLRQEVGWFDDRRNMTGVLTTRLATDATLLHSLTGNQLALILQIIGALASGIIIAFTAHWKIALVVLACLPVIIGCMYIHMSHMIMHAQNMKKAYEQSGKIANEALENVRTVVSLTREDTFIDAFSRELRKPDREGLRATLVHATGSAVQALSQAWITALAFWYGGTLATQENVAFKTIMRATNGITMSSNAIGQAATFFPDYGKSISAAYHIFTLFDREVEIPAPACVAHTAPPGRLPPNVFPTDRAGLAALTASITPITGKTAKANTRSLLPIVASSVSPPAATANTIDDFRGKIEFRDVAFNYPTRKAVNVLTGLSFEAMPQQTVALVGESGCGKSTVISLLERFYDPTGGAILLDDKPTAELDVEWMRTQIGLVSQEPILFATTIEENIRYGKPGGATHEEVVEAAKQANAHGFICSFPDGYNTLVGEKGVTLSGGQKQRVAIARALIRNPKILLLDEATSALDSESEKVVQDALDRARLGRTTVVIAHRLSTIRDADKILVVSNGKVAEQGTHSELMALNGLYASLASAQK